jgi:hypothetical protein
MQYSTQAGPEITITNEPTARCYSKKYSEVEPEGCGRTQEAQGHTAATLSHWQQV